MSTYIAIVSNIIVFPNCEDDQRNKTKYSYSILIPNVRQFLCF